MTLAPGSDAGQAVTRRPHPHEDDAGRAAGDRWPCARKRSVGTLPVTTTSADVPASARRACSAASATTVDAVALGERQAVEEVVAPGRAVLAHDDVAVEPHGDRLAVQQRRHAERRGDLDGHVELALRRVRADLGVDDDGEVGPAVVDVVADHQRAGAGRRHPVDVAVVVAELVLAQGVERDVAGRRGVRRRPLEVLGEPDRQRPQRGDPGVHPQRLRRRSGRSPGASGRAGRS